VSASLATAAPAAFSFVYDGRESGTLLPRWQMTRAVTAEGQTVTWTDPATGMAVRCEIRQYADVPAVDYVLHLTNGGTSNTQLHYKGTMRSIEPSYWFEFRTYQQSCRI
jgi:hypothetical protein